MQNPNQSTLSLQEKTIVINNLKLFFLEGGKGETILFLHGGGVRAKSYLETLESLSCKYHVLAPDIPGFGQSQTPDKIWNFEDYADFFSQFLERLNVRSAVVIGHSFGGGIGLLLAAQNSKVSKLILADSTGLPMNVTFWRLLISLLKKTILQLYFDKNAKTAGILIDFLDSCRRHFWQLSKIYQIAKKCLSSSYPKIQNINIPTLLLWGKYDNLLKLETAYELNHLIKDSRLEIIKGGHDWCLFNPKLFVKEIEEFLKEMRNL